MEERNNKNAFKILLVEDNPADIRLTEEAIEDSKINSVLYNVKDGVEAITLKYLLLFQPTPEAEKEDGNESGDFISIKGVPNVEVVVKGIGQSDLVTATRVVNAIPYVVQARPGLLAMKDFPPFVPLAR